MAKSTHIFVNNNQPIRELKEELESLLKLKIFTVKGIHGIYYQFKDQKIEMILDEHTFDNDKEMNFQDFEYHISVRAINTGTG